MVLVESFYKKLKMSTRYPHRMKNQIFPEFSDNFQQKSGEYFQQHDLRRAFRLPCPERRLIFLVLNLKNNQTLAKRTMHCATEDA